MREIIMTTKPEAIIPETREKVMRWPWSWVAVSKNYMMRWIPEQDIIQWAERGN